MIINLEKQRIIIIHLPNFFVGSSSLANSLIASWQAKKTYNPRVQHLGVYSYKTIYPIYTET